MDSIEFTRSASDLCSMPLYSRSCSCRGVMSTSSLQITLGSSEVSTSLFRRRSIIARSSNDRAAAYTSTSLSYVHIVEYLKMDR